MVKFHWPWLHSLHLKKITAGDVSEMQDEQLALAMQKGSPSVCRKVFGESSEGVSSNMAISQLEI